MRYPEPFEDNGKREILHVVGKTGTGKSTFIRQYMMDKHRIIVYDPKEEYAGPIAESPEEIFDYIEKHPRFMVRTTDIDDLDIICGMAKGFGNIHLIFEEAESIIPQSSIKLPPEMRDIIFRGRKWSVSMLFSSQRPAKIHIDPRSQWTKVIIFNGTESADVDWIESIAGRKLRGTEYDPLFLKVPGEYLEISQGSGFIEKKMTTVLPVMMLHRKAGKEENYREGFKGDVVSFFSSINR